MNTALNGLLGRVNDIDSHEMIPTHRWGDAFGQSGATFAALWEMAAVTDDQNSVSIKAYDELQVTRENVWTRSSWETGASAPGAIDMERRLAVLDLMGVRRQFLFPSGCLAAYMFRVSSPEFIVSLVGEAIDLSTFDWGSLQTLTEDVVRAWNDWAIVTARVDPDRLRPVGILLTEDFDACLIEAQRLVEGGVKGIMIPASIPPGGRSPAHEAVSPLWSLLEESDVSLIFHIAGENFARSPAWREIPAFQGVGGGMTAEFPLDPYSFSTAHFAVENYLTAMILGGVLERHPGLRVAVVEYGARWIGGLAQNLDMWANVFARRVSKTLTMKPSEYMARNLRATCYIFEPIAQIIEQYGLEDVFCYGSDYPHFEGGSDQLATFAGMIAPLGADVMEKFFVTNADLVLPPVAL